ncbi:MAG: alanine--tRNA ligase [Candidatus Methanomethylicia archaeon]
MMKEEYVLEFFKRNSFHRIRCIKCGTYFWTTDPNRTTCGEHPCEPYKFVAEPIMKYYPSLDVIREEFLSFFERNGHKRMPPYPVLARWRDDIYLTIASIAVFQPFVTSGEADPPANPLTISQPCIRLVDIDDVGKSMKHLTIFEMAAHHAFNYPNKEIYWKERTVELCQNFMTEIMDVQPDNITYKESWWEGGGNAGPCFEVCIGGLELATLVFMMYKSENGRYEPMPLKVVDTGYGIERITWVSQREPTIFHSIYNGIMEKILNEGNLTIPDETLKKYVYSTSLLSGKNQIDIIDKNLVKKLQNIFALLDYTKCLTFMLADGIVPSNSGEGYLARLIIRRIIRLMDSINIEIPLIEIINLQIDHWGKTFQHILGMRREINEILSLEEERYNETLRRGERIVQQLINNMKKNKEDTIPISKVIELYDSHGVSPEIIQNIAKTNNIEIEIPSDFYSLIVKKHLSKAQRKQQEPLPIKIDAYPPTRKIFYEDPYTFEFEAKVIDVKESYIIMDSTAFYPEGGGQPSDQGKILWDDKETKIIDVQKLGDIILHKFYGEAPPIGGKIVGIVDKERRLSLMRNHTATHLLLAALINTLGKHVWQTGAQKDILKSRLDITHYKQISEDEIKKVEELANEYVLRNIDVNISTIPRAQAEAMYGVRIYQGGVVSGRDVRIVEIDGINTQACGGLHVKKTGEVGTIKIMKTSKIQDGVIRVEFTCGLSTLKQLQKYEKIITEIMETMKTQEENMTKSIINLKNELEKLRNEYKQLWKMHLKSIVDEIVKHPITHKELKVYTFKSSNLTHEQIVEIGREVLKRELKAAIIIFNIKEEEAEFMIFTKDEAAQLGFDSSFLARLITEKLGGKSGGKKTMAQGHVKDISKIDSINDEIKRYVENILK